MLKEIDGMKTEEICKEFSISQANLWVITHRVRKQMKRCLNKNWEMVNRCLLVNK